MTIERSSDATVTLVTSTDFATLEAYLPRRINGNDAGGWGVGNWPGWGGKGDEEDDGTTGPDVDVWDISAPLVAYVTPTPVRPRLSGPVLVNAFLCGRRFHNCWGNTKRELLQATCTFCPKHNEDTSARRLNASMPHH